MQWEKERKILDRQIRTIKVMSKNQNLLMKKSMILINNSRKEVEKCMKKWKITLRVIIVRAIHGQHIMLIRILKIRRSKLWRADKKMLNRPLLKPKMQIPGLKRKNSLRNRTNEWNKVVTNNKINSTKVKVDSTKSNRDTPKKNLYSSILLFSIFPQLKTRRNWCTMLFSFSWDS